MGENVLMTKCWDATGKKVMTYRLPDDIVIKPHHPFYERIQFYESDVAFHKRQVDQEVVEWWKISKKLRLPKDVFKLITKHYLHRPVEYGCHVPKDEEEQERTCALRLIIYFLMFVTCLFFVLLILIHRITAFQSGDPFVKHYFNRTCANPGPQGIRGDVGPQGMK